MCIRDSYYYARIGLGMWAEDAPDGDTTPIRVPASLVSALAITVALTIAFGVYPPLVSEFDVTLLAGGSGDGAGKGALTSAVLSDDKAIGLPSLPPPCIDSVADNRTKERPHFRGGDEIAATARLTNGCVEALRLVVQGRIDKIGHGDGPVGRYARSESIGQRCGRHEISRRGRRPTA